MVIGTDSMTQFDTLYTKVLKKKKSNDKNNFF